MYTALRLRGAPHHPVKLVSTKVKPSDPNLPVTNRKKAWHFMITLQLFQSRFRLLPAVLWARRLGLVFFFTCMVLPSKATWADVSIERTRIVYPQARRDVSFTVMNMSAENAAVVQMWTDAGDANAQAEDVSTPFLLSPTLLRLAPKGRQTVRLTYTGEPLNSQQESLYWFNTLELPPVYAGPIDADRITFARRTRIKLFFRPTGLKSDVQQAMRQLRCGLKTAEGRWGINCYNPSLFHLSFTSFSLIGAGKATEGSVDGGMIRPRERIRFAVPNYDNLPQPFTGVVFNFVDDFGGNTPVESDLTEP